MKPIKNIVILAIFIILILFQKGESQICTSINYQFIGKSNDAFLAVELPGVTRFVEFGVYDEYNCFKIASGARKTNNDAHIVPIYNIKFIDYISFLRIPLIKDEGNNTNSCAKLLKPSYSTFLTLSYEGTEISNMSIYQKEFNWSSVGIDLLYINNKISFNNPSFYSRFSYILTSSTIQNNPNYFSNTLGLENTSFCVNTKLINTTKLTLHKNSVNYDIIFRTYYRQLYDNLKQYEFGSNLKFRYYDYRSPIVFDCQLGYLRYGIKTKWDDIVTFNLGLTYYLDRNKL